MGKLRMTVLIFFGITVLSYIYTYFFSEGRDGGSAPVLSSDQDLIRVSVYDGTEELLQGMNAYDEEDGDLTDYIRVASISPFVEEKTCDVEYVVFDSDNHAVTYTRQVLYVDYDSPVFGLKEPLQYNIGEKFVPSERVTAEDVFDGDISSKIKLISGEVNSYIVGNYPVKLQVENSRGDTVILSANVHVESRSLFTPVIELKTNLVNAYVDQEFHWQDYIESVKSADGSQNYSIDDVEISSNVNTGTPGCYEVVYRYADENGYTGFAYIVVEVR